MKSTNLLLAAILATASVASFAETPTTVSYTHLTLPTILRV